MKDEEIRSTIEQIKAQVKANPENKDKSDDEIDELILDSFFKTYTEGGMTKEDLLGLAEAMGYEPDEGFENDPEAPSQVEPGEGGGEGAPAGEMSESELEATRTMEPGESKEEFLDKVEDVKEGNPISEEGGESKPESEPSPAPAAGEGEEKGEEGEESSPEADEDAERKAASELWKMDLSKK